MRERAVSRAEQQPVADVMPAGSLANPEIMH